MKYLKYSFIVLFILSLASCDEDQFTSVKTINFPEHESKLAVTSQISATPPGGNIVFPSVFVSHSLGIVDNDQYDIIDDATVELYKDGEPFYEFYYEPLTAEYMCDLNLDFTEGTYTLKVDSPDYEAVEATQTMPKKAEILSTTYQFEAIPFDFDNDLFDLMTVKIQDPAGEENFYSFDVYFEITDTTNGSVRKEGIYTDTDDPLFEFGYNIYHILPDVTFDGNTYDIRIVQNSEWVGIGQNEKLSAAIVRITTLTKDLYIYETSRYINSDAQGNPFAEPVLVHSNIDDGFGVFTLQNIEEFRHEF